MHRLGPVLACVVMMVAGWRAWTGRWRQWAYPTSGWGLMPVLFLPVGLGLLVPAATTGWEEGPDWMYFLALPALAGWLLLLLQPFRLIRRWPRWLRPAWVPAGAPLPTLKVALHPDTIPPGRTNPDSSEWQATENLPARSRRAWWTVLYLGAPPTGYLTGAYRRVRWGRLEVYDEAVAIFQLPTEDYLYRDTFGLTLRAGEVESIVFAPGLAAQWRTILRPDPLQLPQLVLRLRDGSAHQLAMRDPRFRRNAEKCLSLLAQALKVPPPRAV